MPIDQLIAACVDAPDDDAPRLVWGDAIGGDRGELVAIQCMPGLDPNVRRRRERELLASVVDPVDRFAIRTQYARGFVTAIQVDLATLAANADAIVAAAPLLDSVTITGLAGPVNPDTREPAHPAIDELLAMLATTLDHPALARITALDLVDPVARDPSSPATRVLPPTAELIRAFSTWPLASRLRSIGFAGRGWGPNGALALERIAALRPRRLWLRSLRLNGVPQLGASPQLASIDHTEQFEADGLTPLELADRPLEDLALSFVDEPTILALAGGNPGRRLRHLVLDRAKAGGALARLAEMTALETLEIGFDGPAAVQAEALCRAAPPKLRELRIAIPTSIAHVVAIARALGRQLEVLSLAQALSAERHAEIASYVAGDVIDGDATIDRIALIGDVHPSFAIAQRRIPSMIAGGDAYLVGTRGEIWRIDPTGYMRLGRSVNADLRLQDGSVARIHCTLTWDRTGYRIDDLGATNGVIVDGTRIGSVAMLADGNVLDLGRIGVQYFIGPGAGARALAAARLTAADAR